MIAWVRVHPSTIRQVADLFFGGNYKAAARCLARLRKKGRIPHLNILPRDFDGRPQYQQSGWKVGKPMHECLLTEFAMVFPDGEWARGPQVSRKLWPDGEWNNGRFMNVELDTASESEQQYRDHISRFRGSQDPLLIVVHNAEHPTKTPERVQRLVKWGEDVDHIALYIALEDAKKGGWDAVWTDGGGAGITLRKMLGKRVN